MAERRVFLAWVLSQVLERVRARSDLDAAQAEVLAYSELRRERQERGAVDK